MKPYEYYDAQSGSFGGLVIEYFEKVSEITGLQFNYVQRQGQTETIDALNSGEVQLVASLATNCNAEEIYTIMLTDSFYTSTVEIAQNRSIDDALSPACIPVILNGFPRCEKKHKRICVQSTIPVTIC